MWEHLQALVVSDPCGRLVLVALGHAGVTILCLHASWVIPHLWSDFTHVELLEVGTHLETLLKVILLFGVNRVPV